MTSRSEATLSSSELCPPSSLRAPRKSLSGARWLALPIECSFHKRAPQTRAGVSTGKVSVGGCTFQGETLWALVWERGSFRGLCAPSLAVSSGSLFTAALGTPRSSLASRNPMDSAQPLED